MKIKTTASAILAMTTVLSTFGLAFTKSAEAAPRTFSCKMESGAWTTVVNESGKPERQLIRWTSDLGASVGYTPERRCNEVTNRMNSFFSNSGQFITHGIYNGQKVICATDRLGKDCLNLLYTVQPKDDPKAVLKDLFRVNSRNVGNAPVRERLCAATKTYLSVDDLLAGKTIFAREACSVR